MSLEETCTESSNPFGMDDEAYERMRKFATDHWDFTLNTKQPSEQAVVERMGCRALGCIDEESDPLRGVSIGPGNIHLGLMPYRGSIVPPPPY